MSQGNGKISCSPKNFKLMELIKSRIKGLQEEILKEESGLARRRVIEKIEETIALNELILLKLENKDIMYH